MQTEAKNDSQPTAFPGHVARALVVISCLNLNGLAFMVSGRGQLFSPLLLLGSLWLIFVSGRTAVRDPLVIAFAAFTLLYVGMGVLASGAAAPALPHAVTYASSFLIVLALAAHTSSLQSPAEVDRLLRFTKHVLVAASASVLVSAKLVPLYALQLSSLDRNGGFFGNANEAGVVAAAALALVLSAPSRRTWLNLLHGAVAIAAVFMTFSKSGMIISFLVVAVCAIRSGSGAKLLIAAASMAAAWFAFGMLSAVDGLRMSASQRERVGQVLQILSGDVNSQTTTGRTELWSIATDRIEQNPVFGNGLGTFHHMIGGIMNEGVWMGAHNAYLMVWGESGIFPAFALAAAMLLLLVAACRKGVHAFALLYFIILQFDMMAAHNVLALRFHNVLLGIVMGLAIFGAERARSGRPDA